MEDKKEFLDGIAVICYNIINRNILGGDMGSTGVMRLMWHVVDPSPRLKMETNTNANDELALAA